MELINVSVFAGLLSKHLFGRAIVDGATLSLIERAMETCVDTLLVPSYNAHAPGYKQR